MPEVYWPKRSEFNPAEFLLTGLPLIWHSGIMRNRSRKKTTDVKPMNDSPPKDPAAVALGRKGGLKGGPARAAKMTKRQRRESAQKAARARWAKAKQEHQ
jgi:hypothetical protein